LFLSVFVRRLEETSRLSLKFLPRRRLHPSAAAYGVDDLADADGDGDSDGEDFLVWQLQYTGSLDVLAVTKPVPEPGTATLLLAAGLCALSRRR
jgi:hypothetical protein